MIEIPKMAFDVPLKCKECNHKTREYMENFESKIRADERAKIIDLIDRHMWNYSKEVWEDFQSVLKQLKEQK